MKWKTTPRPSYNEMRIVKKFAWLPVKLNDEYTIWLEKYYSVERYVCGVDVCCWVIEWSTQDNDTAKEMVKSLNP